MGEGSSVTEWYRDEALTDMWDFDRDIMPDEPVTLYAKWEAHIHTVTYISDDEVIRTDEVAYDSHLEAPELTGIGKHVVGWYRDPSFTTKWNFESDTMPDEAITLYVKWDVNEYMVTYIHGTNSSTELVAYGSKLLAPEDPVKEGYQFVGWSQVEGSLADLWDFETGIMPAHDLKLYAVYGEYILEGKNITLRVSEVLALREKTELLELIEAKYTLLGETYTTGIALDWDNLQATVGVYEVELSLVDVPQVTKKVSVEVIPDPKYQVVAHDIEVQLSELRGLTERKVLDLAEAHVREVGMSSYLSHSLMISNHNVEGKPGDYTVTIAMVEADEVKTDIILSVIDDRVTKPNPKPDEGNNKDQDSAPLPILPQTGISPNFRGWELILGGFFLLWKRKRKESEEEPEQS